jgi:uncharacterized protein YbbK (DUF523 family)
MIVVSSCLSGLAVRYNESHCLDNRIKQLIDRGEAVSVCPELLGGFSIPREPAEIVGGDGKDVLNGTARVVTKSGADVTEQYIKGAYLTLKKVRELHATEVVLKENSPSCGSNKIYSGAFNGQKVEGNGVTAALLESNGIKVVSEEKLAEIL